MAARGRSCWSSRTPIDQSPSRTHRPARLKPIFRLFSGNAESRPGPLAVTESGINDFRSGKRLRLVEHLHAADAADRMLDETIVDKVLCRELGRQVREEIPLAFHVGFLEHFNHALCIAGIGVRLEVNAVRVPLPVANGPGGCMERVVLW